MQGDTLNVRDLGFGYIFAGEGGEAESSFLHVLVFISDRKI